LCRHEHSWFMTTFVWLQPVLSALMVKSWSAFTLDAFLVAQKKNDICWKLLTALKVVCLPLCLCVPVYVSVSLYLPLLHFCQNSYCS